MKKTTKIREYNWSWVSKATYTLKWERKPNTKNNLKELLYGFITLEDLKKCLIKYKEVVSTPFISMNHQVIEYL